MEVNVKWVGDMSFLAETGSGHSIVMDGAPDAGGRNLAARPMEMVLAGLGGCSSFDVVRLLREAGQDVHGVDLALTAKRAETGVGVFTEIKGHFTIKGKSIAKPCVASAVSQSAQQLSSVAKMLEKSAKIDWDYEVIEI